MGGEKFKLRMSEGLTLLSFLETCCWCMVLMFIALGSFVTNEFHEAGWLALSTGFYILFSIYFVLISLGAKHNSNALKSAKWILICMILSLLWVVLQSESGLLNSVEHFYTSDHNEEMQTVKWLDVRSLITFNQEKVHWYLLKEIMLLMFFASLLCMLRTRSRVKQMLTLFVLVGACHSGIAVLAKFSNELLVERAQLDGHFDAARGWFINRNHFAASISLLLFGGIALILKQFFQQKKTTSSLVQWLRFVTSPQILILCFVGLALFALMLSQSRAGFFGVILTSLSALTLFAFYDEKFYINRKLLVSFCLFIAIMLTLYGGEILTRLATSFFSLGERTLQWQLTLQIIAERVLFGYGVGSYEAIFQLYRDGQTFRQVVFDQAHNEFLQIFLEQGLIGLVLWLSVIVLFCYRIMYVYFRTNSTLIKSVSIAALIVFSATILQSFVDFHLQLPIIQFYLLLIMACAISVATISR